jgi:hypothetical protein
MADRHRHMADQDHQQSYINIKFDAAREHITGGIDGTA